MRRFFIGSKSGEQDKKVNIDEDSSVDIDTVTPKPDASTQTVSTDQNDEELKKALSEYTEDDWKTFAKEHPQIIKIITEVTNENQSSTEPENDCEIIESNLNQSGSRLSIISAPRQFVANFIEKSLAFIGQFYYKIQNKFTQGNLKLIEEVLTEILQSFAYQENSNRENSVAIAFVLRGLTKAQTLPTIREIPNIGIYITVLTIIIEMLKVFMHISFSPDKQELRSKIAKIFE